MLVLSDKTFFEENAAELLSNAGLNKAKFAEKMGVVVSALSELSTKEVERRMIGSEVSPSR